MKVNLFLVGFQKSGTTSLALWLKSHPNIFLPSHKEPHYFSKNVNLDEKLYIKNFNLNEKYQYFLDASTSYAFYHEYPQTPYNIYKYNPNAFIICITRDPIKRIESHFTHRIVKDREKKGTINDIVFSNPIYIDRTRYYTNIKQYIKLFGIERCLILSLEDILLDELDLRKKISVLLNLNENGFGVFPVANKSIVEKETINYNIANDIRFELYKDLLYLKNISNIDYLL